MAALFLIQTVVGGMAQHYRADLGGFFGIDVAQVFPYNLVRTWHVQLAIFFVASSYLAIGIFHWVFRKQFLQLSFGHDSAEAKGPKAMFWDLLFYLSFGFVITSSVQIAGTSDPA